MKLNKKGFTLIELLVTIVIVGLVVGISIYGIVKTIEKTEERKIALSISNIKEAARIYSSEANSFSWMENTNDTENDFFCVTIGELMNKGLIDKNATLGNNVTKDNFVIVKRNKITLSVVKEIITEKDDDNDKFCRNPNAENTYTITYNANATTVSNMPSPQTENVGNSIKISKTFPIRAGYIFVSWNTNSDGTGTSYAPEDTYTGNTDVTLYAQWSKHTEHDWTATGNTIFTLTGYQSFSCDYCHDSSYARYCSKCGMSVRYYREYIDKESTKAKGWCPYSIRTNESVTIVFDDSSFKVVDNDSASRNNIKQYCGLSCGQKMLEISNTPQSELSEISGSHNSQYHEVDNACDHIS